LNIYKLKNGYPGKNKHHCYVPGYRALINIGCVAHLYCIAFFNNKKPAVLQYRIFSITRKKNKELLSSFHKKIPLLNISFFK